MTAALRSSPDLPTLSRSAGSARVGPPLQTKQLLFLSNRTRAEKRFSVANVTGGNADGVYRAGGHLFPRQADLVRGNGPPGLGAEFCPRPRLPVSVALEASLFAGPQVIHKQIMETNSVCLLSPHGAVALCRRARGCTCSASSTKRRIDYGGRGLCPMTVFLLKLLPAHDEGIFVSIVAFELSWDIRARFEPCASGAVWKEAEAKAERTAALCGSHAVYTAHKQYGRRRN